MQPGRIEKTDAHDFNNGRLKTHVACLFHTEDLKNKAGKRKGSCVLCPTFCYF